MTEYFNYNHHHSRHNNNNNNYTKSGLHFKGATYCSHVLRTAAKNVARTHIIFKIGFALVNLALVLYLVGFVSPYWVVGAKHAHKDKDEFSYSCEDGQVSNLSDVHFGLWEECVTCDGVMTCRIFTENIDSVILMFGCVGVFLLFILCCWSLLTCVRKPRKRRYFVAVVLSIVGGVFGCIAAFTFITVQEYKPYSWAFAVFLIACLLELSAAAIFLLAVTRASLGGTFDDDEDKMGAPTTPKLPTILLTGATPTEKNARRRVRVLQTSSRRRRRRSQRQFSEESEDEDVEFVTLDMVSELPGQRAGGQRRKTRKKRRRKKRVQIVEESTRSPSTTEGSPVDSTACDRVTDGRSSGEDVCTAEDDGKFNAGRSATPVSRPLILANSQSETRLSENETTASVDADTKTAPSLPQKQGQFKNLENFRVIKKQARFQELATSTEDHKQVGFQKPAKAEDQKKGGFQKPATEGDHRQAAFRKSAMTEDQIQAGLKKPATTQSHRQVSFQKSAKGGKDHQQAGVQKLFTTEEQQQAGFQRSATVKEGHQHPPRGQTGSSYPFHAPSHRMSLSAEVHRTFTITEALEALDSSEEYHTTSTTAICTARDTQEHDDNIASLLASPIQVHPLLPSRQAQVKSLSQESEDNMTIFTAWNTQEKDDNIPSLLASQIEVQPLLPSRLAQVRSLSQVNDDNIPSLLASQIHLQPLLPNRQAQDNSFSPQMTQTESETSPEKRALCRTPVRTTRQAITEENKENAGDSDYVRYSPDTYYQSRGNCYIFKQTTEL